MRYGAGSRSTVMLRALGELAAELYAVALRSHLAQLAAQYPRAAGGEKAYDGLGRLQHAQHQNLGLGFPGTPAHTSDRSVVTGLASVDLTASGDPKTPGDGAAVCPSVWNASCGLPVQTIAVLRDKVGRVGSFTATVSRPNQPQDVKWRGYAYDGMGRLTTAHEAAALPTVSAATHTLTSVQVASLAASAGADTWGYAREPSVGSLLSITRATPGADPRFVSPARGPGYQLTQYNLDGVANRAVQHDSAGRLVGDGTRSYLWDDFSALVAVEEEGVAVEAMQYDGLGRLVARWDASGAVAEELAYDGAQMVASFDASQALKWSASWAPGVDALLSISNTSGEYLAMEDGKANVVGYFRADDSQLAGTAEFTPEGRTKWQDFLAQTSCGETGNTKCGPLLGLPFGFHSAYKSVGTGLVYFRNRWYSTEAGQWLSQDPLGYVDSYNSYAFNKFDPVNFIDPWGLKTTSLTPQEKSLEGESADDYCKRTGALCGDEVVVIAPVASTQAPVASTAEKGAASKDRGTGMLYLGDSMWLPKEAPNPKPQSPSAQRPDIKVLKKKSADELRKIPAKVLSLLAPVDIEELDKEQSDAVAETLGGSTSEVVKKVHAEAETEAKHKGFEKVTTSIADLANIWAIGGAVAAAVVPTGAVSSAARGAGAIRRVGDVLETVDDALANPQLLKRLNPADYLTRTGGRLPQGWRVEALGQGSHKGQGWVLRQFTSRGNATGRQLRWHPGGGHHGLEPYWRVLDGNAVSEIIEGAAWPR